MTITLNTRTRHLVFAAVLVLLAAGLAGSALAEVSDTLRAAFPGAIYVDRYTPLDRANAAQAALHLDAPPRLGPSASLTPDQTFGTDGSALNIWKPSFVLGTAEGGEAGVNFWDQHSEGHFNVVFTPDSTHARLIDCRFLTNRPIMYKVYSGPGSAPLVEKAVDAKDRHVLVAIAVVRAGQPVLVEFWPTSTSDVVAFFGCDISTMG